MGCWSESCGVSGMEIPSGNQCYLATIAPSKYGEVDWCFVTPPVKGTYDDYGGIDLLEDVPYLNLKKGDNYSPEDAQKYFIDAQVFEMLGTLKPEYSYDGSQTLAEATSKYIKAIENWENERKSLENEVVNNEYAKFRLEMHEQKLYNVLGSGSNSLFQNAEKLIKEHGINFLAFYERSYLLGYAIRELRKRFVPSSGNSPQHGGEQALIPFYSFVLKEAKKRKRQQ
jgi:hypothetical protein